MTVERAMVARAKPHITAELARTIMQEESGKGSSLCPAPVPVELEPPFRDFHQEQDIFAPGTRPGYVPAHVPAAEDLVRFILWVTPGFVCDWARSERFLKQLQACEYSLAFEITGNESHIILSFLCDKRDATVLAAAFLGEYPECTMTIADSAPLNAIPPDWWNTAAFREFVPPPPYSHLFTRPGELRDSPFTPLLNIMARLPKSAMGLYQLLFVPVRQENNWHDHIRLLLDLEFSQAMYAGMQPYYRYAQQMPSNDLRGSALDVEQKSHNDKPLYAAVARMAVFSGCLRGSEEHLRTLSVPMNLFQHGGRPFQFVGHDVFRTALDVDAVWDMFLYGLSYRPGFILNSEELSGFVHPPPIPASRQRVVPLGILDGLAPTSAGLASGTLIGYREQAGVRWPIHIPPRYRGYHGHIIGKSGMGKSWLIEGMFLQDIQHGGAALIDPHGDLASRLLGLIPEDCLDRVVFFDPGDDEWVFLWNVLALRSGQDPSRLADELTAAFHKISDGWGDRLGHILRQTITGVLYLEGGTLADVVTLLRSAPEERRHLVQRIIAATDNPTTKRFWEADFKGYKPADVQPVLHKLDKLMAPRGVAKMCSQPVNKIDFRRIMDEGLIFVADLSHIGADVRDILGTFITSSIYLAALSRSDIPEDRRKQFHFYADEAHRFIAGAMTDLIAQTRKHRVSITLAQQYLSQLKPEDIDALGTTGFTVVFGVLHKDAERLLRMLGAEAPPQDLLAFEPGDALARIGAEWIKVKTPERSTTPSEAIRAKAIALSREKYYCRACDLSQDPPHRKDRIPRAMPLLDNETEADYVFDRFYPKEV